jgi:hypothetical protein
MATGREVSIWEKVDPTLIGSTAPAPAKPKGAGDAAEWRRFWRRRRPVLDVVASLFWLYAVLKVFFVDVDEVVFGDLSDDRVFFFLAIAAGLAVLLRRTGPFIAGCAYILGFPLVIALWKLPKWLWKLRSPGAFLVTGNAIATVLGNLRRTVVTVAIATITALVIAVSTSDALLGTGGAILAVLVGQAIWRTIRLSVVPSRFLRFQQEAIRKVVASPMTQGLLAPAEELKSPAIQKFDRNQQNTFLQNLGNAVIAHRALNFWAYQLETYRRGPATLFFNAASYLWLLVRSIVGLAFINYALYRADPSAFAFDDRPSFLVFVRYVIAGLYGSEIDALHSHSNLADLLSIATFVVGLLVLGSLVLSAALSFRAARDQSEIQETIAEIKRQGDQVDERLRREYEVSVEEAAARLEQLEYGLMGLINFLSTRIPRGPEP